jgi:hypothetical protein
MTKIAVKMQAAFYLDIADGMTAEDALKVVAEAAKTIKPYKNFGPVKTTVYIFWDGSAFMCGIYPGNVFYAGRDSYEELDAVHLSGMWR